MAFKYLNKTIHEHKPTGELVIIVSQDEDSANPTYTVRKRKYPKSEPFSVAESDLFPYKSKIPFLEKCSQEAFSKGDHATAAELARRVEIIRELESVETVRYGLINVPITE